MAKPKESNRDVYERNSKIYKLLANAKRLEILNLLADGQMTVTELVKAMDIRKANVSQHLAILRYLRLVTVKRVGKNAFYTLTDPRILELRDVLDKMWKTNIFNI